MLFITICSISRSWNEPANRSSTKRATPWFARRLSDAALTSPSPSSKKSASKRCCCWCSCCCCWCSCCCWCWCCWCWCWCCCSSCYFSFPLFLGMQLNLQNILKYKKSEQLTLFFKRNADKWCCCWLCCDLCCHLYIYNWTFTNITTYKKQKKYLYVWGIPVNAVVATVVKEYSFQVF